MAVTAPARTPWAAPLRVLERDERLFAVLLAFVMVGGLATLGLVPLRPRHRVDVYSLVIWFGLYKAGILALVTVNPRGTRGIFTGALCIDLMLVFSLLYLTGGGDSPFVNLFFPLVAVNAYYFGRWVGLLLTVIAGMLYWTAAWLAPPDAAWTAVAILMGLVGLPAFALGHVADRERRTRAEVERLNAELTGTLTRLQAAQEELVEAERMATVGRLSLKVAHEVRNPIAAIELNAELLGDMVQGRVSEDGTEATALIGAIRDQVSALDALTEEYLAFARFPRPQFEEDSVNEMVTAVAEFVRPLAARQGITVKVSTDETVPPMEIDRTLLRQAVLNLMKNGIEAAPQGGALTLTTRQVAETVEIAVSDNGPGITAEVGKRLFEQFFTTKPQGTGLGLSISRQILEEHGGTLRWSSTLGEGATFTMTLPIKRAEHV
ncbi:MAG TPA: ATP-binding protein [Candidatus Dormibacteraeota bacterium]|nr:ATP-binding protein [Candidatus Dormibacteraeota bacterium]